MKEDWAERLKNKMEGHQMPPPIGLWEGISEQMGQQQETVRRRTIIPVLWRRGIAAAIAILLGGSVWFFSDPRNTPITTKEVTSTTKTVSNKPKSMPLLTQSSPKEVVKRRKGKANDTKNVETNEVPSLAEVEVEKDTLEQPRQVLDTETASKPHSFSGNELPLMAEEITDMHRSRWALSVDASGGVLGNETALLARHTYISGYTTAYSMYDKVKHYLPVRVGIGLQYKINERVALLTGIRYTYLHSRFSMSFNEQSSFDQHLHYLGIPLGIRFQFWGNRLFQCYASANVTLDKCLNERPWQFSLLGAAGVEYLPIHQLGLYVEPSIGYYFKDGTSLRHYYKQHPVAPSIDFGLRLHLGK